MLVSLLTFLGPILTNFEILLETSSEVIEVMAV